MLELQESGFFCVLAIKYFKDKFQISLTAVRAIFDFNFYVIVRMVADVCLNDWWRATVVAVIAHMSVMYIMIRIRCFNVFAHVQGRSTALEVARTHGHSAIVRLLTAK
jgi:hypothetical protein